MMTANETGFLAEIDAVIANNENRAILAGVTYGGSEVLRFIVKHIEKVGDALRTRRGKAK